MLSQQSSLYKELARQFGEHDAKHFMLAPQRYAHHFDGRTKRAYQNECRHKETKIVAVENTHYTMRYDRECVACGACIQRGGALNPA